MIRLLLVSLIVCLSQAAVFRVPVGFDEDNGIGTPGQKLKTRYDTGSDLVWVKDVACHDGHVQPCNTGPDGKSYDCSASSTCQESGEPFDGRYGGGAYANGTYMHETISLLDSDEPKVTVENTQVGRATVMQGFSTDASLGLAPTSPFIKDVKDRKIFNENIFTVWIHEAGRTQGQAGLITYGAFDSEHCDHDIAYIPIDEECGLHYCIKFESVAYGDANYPGGFGLSDTGNSAIRGPLEVVEEIARRAGWGGAKTQGGNYAIPCDAQTEPLVFHIGDKQFAIETKHLIAVDPFDQDGCRLTIKGEKGRTMWMFGVPFIRQFCQVYDFGNRRLGLAKSLS